MISHLDAQVGRVLDALEKGPCAKNTLVIFTGDSGLAVGKHGLMGKQNLYEHSMKPPLILAGPGVPAGKQSDALAYLFDLLPTICDYVGVAQPDGVEGKSLRSIVDGRQAKVRDEIFGAYRQFQRSVRDERWKLIRYPHINKSQLFDSKTDPDELQDLAADPKHADALRRMTALLEAKQREFGDKQPLSTDKPAPLQIELKVEKQP
jgi:arylsulfatase A-like enzyme